jgi:hypothetical protein
MPGQVAAGRGRNGSAPWQGGRDLEMAGLRPSFDAQRIVIKNLQNTKRGEACGLPTPCITDDLRACMYGTSPTIHLRRVVM